MSTSIQSEGIACHSIHINCDDVVLGGDLALPERARGLVLFVHGSGSSRHSPRNRMVAMDLAKINFATLLFDLLSAEEEAIDLQTAQLRFNIPLLARRVLEVIDWIRRQPELRELPIGLFGASTGAAAALVAAAHRPRDIAAVVSRGGRPDLANAALTRVRAPTLMIVGGNDLEVVELNEQAMSHMSCEKSLGIIPGATHLFEEPGALEQVSYLASGWFGHHLAQPSASDRVLPGPRPDRTFHTTH